METPEVSHLARLEGFRKSDAERDQMIENLIKDYEQLHTKYREKCSDFDNETHSRRMWQAKSNEADIALTSVRQSSSSNAFAVAVIDGDGALFLDALYAMGKDGGAEAAQLLHDELTSQLRNLYPNDNISSWSIYVTVVLNMQGLASTLHARGLIFQPAELVAFARAFGRAKSLFQIIDVGSGKECADHKARETLKFFLPIAQCKHVFFGPCSDTGYIPVLEPYKRDNTVKNRLTLIETRPAEPGFIDLGFNRVQLPNIFRSDDLPYRPGMHENRSNGTTSTLDHVPIRVKSNFDGATAPFVNSAPYIPPRNTSPAQSLDPTISGAPSGPAGYNPASSSWATVGKSAASKIISVASAKATPRKFALLNAYDDRLDTVLPQPERSAEQRLADRYSKHGNLCNNYHLGGDCDGDFCDYWHGEALTKSEKLVLMHKARSLACPQRSYCRKVDCYLGHQCKFGKKCYFDVCRLRDSHDNDPEVAKKLYEDGTEEWLSTYLEKYKKQMR